MKTNRLHGLLLAVVFSITGVFVGCETGDDHHGAAPGEAAAADTGDGDTGAQDSDPHAPPPDTPAEPDDPPDKPASPGDPPDDPPDKPIDPHDPPDKPPHPDAVCCAVMTAAGEIKQFVTSPKECEAENGKPVGPPEECGDVKPPPPPPPPDDLICCLFPSASGEVILGIVPEEVCAEEGGLVTPGLEFCDEVEPPPPPPPPEEPVCCLLPTSAGEVKMVILSVDECLSEGGIPIPELDACDEDPPPPPPEPDEQVCCLVKTPFGEIASVMPLEKCLDSGGEPIGGPKACEDPPPPPPPPSEVVCCELITPAGTIQWVLVPEEVCVELLLGVPVGDEQTCEELWSEPPTPDPAPEPDVCCVFASSGGALKGKWLPMDECLADGGKPVDDPSYCKSSVPGSP